MQFPESWLRQYCNPALNTEELSHLLTMAGLEVEEMNPVAPPFHGIVIAEILTAEQHPNADRLRVCTVSAGALTPEPLQIVCGAPNARAGIRIPLAMVGAELPPGEDGKPFKIGKGKLRGVESFGMLCSARELKLSEDHGGLLELPADAPLGTSIRDYLKLDDTLFTLKLTPNLAHCLSVYGIAREVSALTGTPLQAPALAPVKVSSDEAVPVEVQSPDLCGRFAGRVIRHLNLQAKTPDWMVSRLERCGQRSVSALVDISNYVMFELGRPSHIFDLDKIHGGLTVRWAREGEQLKLLNGNTVSLDSQVGVIADSQAVESLAGIMGGDATAVGDDTRHVYVEAAYWLPGAIAGRARRYNFSTDASHRFERGVDPEQIPEHIDYITQLILEICGTPETVVGPVTDARVNVPVRAPVRLRVERAARIIGLPITQQQCADVFARLGLAFTEGEGVIDVTPPSWRFDLQIEEDLVEEVIRVLGFHLLNEDAPIGPVRAQVRPEKLGGVHALRRAVASLDYQETINFSFVEARWESELAGNDQPIALLNPIASQLSVMRSSLIGSLVSVLRFNLARKAPRVRVFELGKVFLRDESVQDTDRTVKGLHQPLRLAGLAYGPAEPTQWGAKERAVDFFDVKGDLEALFAPRKLSFVAAEHPALHPGRSAQVLLEGQVIGVIGELHPKWRQGYELPQAPVVFELEADAVRGVVVPEYAPISRQPAVQRDLALIVQDGTSFASLEQAITGAAHEGLVRGVQLFDIYKPQSASADMAANERSYALRLTLQDDQATLTEERIEAAVQSVLQALGGLGVRLRA